MPLGSLKKLPPIGNQKLPPLASSESLHVPRRGTAPPDVRAEAQMLLQVQMKHEVAAPGVKKRAVLGAIKKPPPPASGGGEGTSDPSLDFGLPSSYASSNAIISKVDQRIEEHRLSLGKEDDESDLSGVQDGQQRPGVEEIPLNDPQPKDSTPESSKEHCAEDNGLGCTELLASVPLQTLELPTVEAVPTSHEDLQGPEERKSHQVHQHARHGRIKQVQEFLDNGGEVDLKDDAGNTPLHVAAQQGNKRLVKALLRAGADIDAQNSCGQTAAHFAMAYYPVLGEYMLSKGASSSVKNKWGFNCMEALAERPYITSAFEDGKSRVTPGAFKS